MSDFRVGQKVRWEEFHEECPKCGASSENYAEGTIAHVDPNAPDYVGITFGGPIFTVAAEECTDLIEWRESEAAALRARIREIEEEKKCQN